MYHFLGGMKDWRLLKSSDTGNMESNLGIWMWHLEQSLWTWGRTYLSKPRSQTVPWVLMTAKKVLWTLPRNLKKNHRRWRSILLHFLKRFNLPMGLDFCIVHLVFRCLLLMRLTNFEIFCYRKSIYISKEHLNILEMEVLYSICTTHPHYKRSWKKYQEKLLKFVKVASNFKLAIRINRSNQFAS